MAPVRAIASLTRTVDGVSLGCYLPEVLDLLHLMVKILATAVRVFADERLLKETKRSKRSGNSRASLTLKTTPPRLAQPCSDALGSCPCSRKLRVCE